MPSDEILFFSGALAFTEDGDLYWEMMLNNGEQSEEEITETA